MVIDLELMITFNPQLINSFFIQVEPALAQPIYLGLMPLRLRLQPYATKGNLLPLNSHPQDRLGRNQRTFSIIVISEQCPVNLAV